MSEIEYTVEVWRGVDGYEDYEVSNLGRVRSWRSGNGRGRWRETPVIKALVSEKHSGYLLVRIHNGKTQRVRVHTLVINAFSGPRDSEKSQTRHLDGNPKNNRADNLRWGTSLENHNDRVIHGNNNAGEKHPLARLTAKQVLEIVARSKSGESQSRIAKDYGMKQPQVSSIMTGKAWSTVTGLENTRRKKATAGN